MNKDKRGFVAANAVPWKLIKNTAWLQKHEDNSYKIVPYHLQFIPTNRCNLNCSWCSCSSVDRKIELDIGEIRDIIAYFKELGTKAVTITGGGEPTIHKDFLMILELFSNAGISTGLVTNAKKWTKAFVAELLLISKACDWIRISVTDFLTIGELNRVLNNLRYSDVGFSYVVDSKIDFKRAYDAAKLIESCSHATHIRFVSDILSPDVGLMNLISLKLQDFEKAIFQPRSDFTRGVKRCLISLLKPVVDATGYVYPCCGAQYALNHQTRRMPEELCMGYWNTFEEALPFDGSICDKCYYKHYNDAIANFIDPIHHEEFL